MECSLHLQKWGDLYLNNKKKTMRTKPGKQKNKQNKINPNKKVYSI